MTSSPPSAPWAWCRSFRSIEGLRAAWKLPEAPLLSTSATGGCSCVVSLVDLGGVRIAATHLGGSTFTAGFSSADELTATVVLESAGGTIKGLALEPGGILVFPPGTLYRGWNAGGYRWLTITMTREDAARLAREHHGQPPDLRGGALLASRCSAEDMRSIRAMIREIGLWKPRPRPEALDPGPLTRHVAIWGRILARAWIRGATKSASPRRKAGDALLRRVLAFMEAHLADALSSADVCAAAGAPERTVEHAFRVRLGTSPLRYLTVLRLRAARRALRGQIGIAGTTVADIARSVGFRHMSRFSGAYRRMFGESPMETRPVLHTASARGVEGAVDLLEEMAWGP